jgi:Flp pilus assembly pilin Flp
MPMILPASFRTWWGEEDGQDLTEYTLLLAFVVLISAALLLTNQKAIDTIWLVTNNNLSAAVSAVQ